MDMAMEENREDERNNFIFFFYISKNIHFFEIKPLFEYFIVNYL